MGMSSLAADVSRGSLGLEGQVMALHEPSEPVCEKPEDYPGK